MKTFDCLVSILSLFFVFFKQLSSIEIKSYDDLNQNEDYK